MDIFYIEIEKFYKNLTPEQLETFVANFNDRKLTVEKRIKEHSLSRFLVRFVAKNFYKQENSRLEIKNAKPQFVNSDLQFSISHSENIVIAAFGKHPAGIDIEKIKPRNFEKLFNFYNLKPALPLAQKFYEFWTKHEAKIKLQNEVKKVYTFNFGENYICSVASSIEFWQDDINLYEIDNDGKYSTLNSNHIKIYNKNSLLK